MNRSTKRFIFKIIYFTPTCVSSVLSLLSGVVKKYDFEIKNESLKLLLFY